MDKLSSISTSTAHFPHPGTRGRTRNTYVQQIDQYDVRVRTEKEFAESMQKFETGTVFTTTPPPLQRQLTKVTTFTQLVLALNKCLPRKECQINNHCPQLSTVHRKNKAENSWLSPPRYISPVASL